MIDPDISKYAELLKQQYIFLGLDEAQLAHVVTRFQRVELGADEIIYSQGDPGDSFYVVYMGRVRILHMDGAQERQLRIISIGDYFGEEALLFDRQRTDTAVTMEPCILLRLEREAFLELMELAPGIRMNLSATAESRYIAQKEKFDWLGEDEVIYLICRKHWYFLILSMLLPIFIGLASIPVFVFSFTLDSPSLNTFGLLVAALILIFSGLWGIYRWVDWGNDYYIVTSQRVVWLEKVIFFYYSRREAPLTHVLSIDIKSSLIGRILNFGDLDVRTFTGGIPMRRIADPNLFISFIAGYQLRAQQRMRESELKKIQKDIGDLDKDRYAEFLKTLKKKAPKEKEKEKPLPLIDWREIIDTFLKVRYEKDGTITYRKHWLVLIRKTFLPGLTLMALFVFAIFTLYQYLFKEGFGISGFPVTVVIGLFILAAFLWWLYHYLDWNNDIYRLTPEQVLDIERKPLGEEQKKTAPLDSILSLEHSREGIIRLIFNYGDVVINIGQTKFIFLGVHNPDHVHQDVANYIEARRRKKLEVSAQIERERMMDWFSTYQQRVDEGEESKKDTDWDLFPG